jgi:hypothetical protein
LHEVAAAGAASFVGNGAGGIRAQPVATQITQRINALNGEARQILHVRSLSGHQLCSYTGGPRGSRSPGGPKRNAGGDCHAEGSRCQEKTATTYSSGVALWIFRVSTREERERGRKSKPAPLERKGAAPRRCRRGRRRYVRSVRLPLRLLGRCFRRSAVAGSGGGRSRVETRRPKRSRAARRKWHAARWRRR